MSTRYTEEVLKHPDQLKHLRTLPRQGVVTLVFSAHNEIHNDAIVLRDFLLGRPMKPKRKAQPRTRYSKRRSLTSCGSETTCSIPSLTQCRNTFASFKIALGNTT